MAAGLNIESVRKSRRAPKERVPKGHVARSIGKRHHVTWLAIRLAPSHGWSLGVLALTPISVFLATVCSVDATANALAFLWTAYVLRVAATGLRPARTTWLDSRCGTCSPCCRRSWSPSSRPRCGSRSGCGGSGGASPSRSWRRCSSARSGAPSRSSRRDAAPLGKADTTADEIERMRAAGTSVAERIEEIPGTVRVGKVYES
jgi:hypothetical protein